MARSDVSSEKYREARSFKSAARVTRGSAGRASGSSFVDVSRTWVQRREGREDGPRDVDVTRDVTAAVSEAAVYGPDTAARSESAATRMWLTV